MKIEIEITKNPVKVYNFEVEDYHTYFVSDDSVLVHNLCAKGDFKPVNPKSFEQTNGLAEKSFHQVVKKKIIEKASEDILKKVGSNPDIYLNRAGQIQLVSRIYEKVSHVTDMNIYRILEKLR